MGATGIELGVEHALRQVLDRLAEPLGRAWVVGDVGSGRSTLAARLVEELAPRAWIVDLADLEEPDAPIGGFFSAAAWLPDVSSRQACLRDWPSLGDAAHTLDTEARRCASGTRFTLMVKVPDSWEASPAGADDDLAFASAARGRALLCGLARAEHLRIVWLTSRTAMPELVGGDSLDPIPLPAPRNALALLRTVSWGPYRDAADRLHAAAADVAEPSPLAVRLAVAVVALGGRVDVAAQRLGEARAPALRMLADDLAERLASNVACSQAVSRLLLARREISRSEVAALVGVPSEHVPLVTDCVGYGERAVRVSPPIRDPLRRKKGLRLSADDLERAHRSLADYHAKLDGAPVIADTERDGTRAWLERMHHRAHCEPSGDLDLPCRELYWDRGRYLSIEQRAFAEAAKVYDACLDRFPDDGYSQHYLAYNLERAGRKRERAEQAFREAVRLDCTNPWWNSRLATFLLGQGRLRAARKAWREALDNVDPDGARTGRDGWLADHFHYWVARGFLEAGSAADALGVLRAVPEDVVAASQRLRGLRQQILDAVEADAIGEAVYPPHAPTDRRWREPVALPREHDGAPRERWFPGKIVALGDDGVRLVYAARLDDGTYETSATLVDMESWQKMDFPDPAVGTFVELGIYRGGSRRVCRTDDEWAAWRKTAEGEAERLPSADLPLAYFDRWRSPT
ncbi:MAG: hypothetical protein HY744_05970 [Deltaproteobacteria bacterium]|nr:hypothetical protein [Deltaproteobacteria bacterium]